MAKRQTGWTEKKIDKYYKEGRGSGELSGYKPWLTIQDVPSKGRSHRPKGWKTGRIHQLLSDLEFNYFCLLEWADDVLDIREQFPLNRELTIKIAESIGIKHPTDPKTQTPIIMTTDFFITVRRKDEVVYLARTLKHVKELNDDSVIDKFEIERAYWEEQGVSWAIVSEKQINSTTVENIKWIHKSFFDHEENEKDLINNLLLELSQEERTIISVLTQFDDTYKLEHGTALSLFRWLLAKKNIQIDIKSEFNLKNDTSSLQIPRVKLSEKRLAT
jgi:hypothetical protein